MPAADKLQLVAVTEKEYAKLAKLISETPEALALCKDQDDTSIKDVIAHRAHWIALFLGWYADGQAGKEVFFPAKGYKWNELKRYNRWLRQEQAHLTWPEAQQLLEHRHHSLSQWINAMSDEALYTGPMKGAKNEWTPGRWAEAAGPSHYRSAAKYLRARRKQG